MGLHDVGDVHVPEDLPAVTWAGPSQDPDGILEAIDLFPCHIPDLFSDRQVVTSVNEREGENVTTEGIIESNNQNAYINK